MEEMTTQQVANMIVTMLQRNIQYLTGRAEPLVADDVWCLERAGNIAAALTGITVK